MRHSLYRMIVAGIGALLICATDAQASALACGDVVTEDVVLQADLLDCPGDGLVVDGADVTVDLNFHRIDGTGSGAGVRILAPEVRLRNGSIGGFGTGVHVEGAELVDARLAGLDIASNGRGVSLAGELGSAGGGSATIVGSRIHHNTGAGITAGFWRHVTHIRFTSVAANGGSGVLFRDSLGASVTWSWIARNGSAGISFDFAGGGRVAGSVITGNGTFGVGANRSGGLRVVGNLVTRNGRPGEFSGGAFVLEGFATIEDNVFNENLGFGLALDEPLETRSQWPINRNTANRNAGFGITAAQPGFTGVGNVAKRNGEPLQCANFPCNVKKR